MGTHSSTPNTTTTAAAAAAAAAATAADFGEVTLQDEMEMHLMVKNLDTGEVMLLGEDDIEDSSGEVACRKVDRMMMGSTSTSSNKTSSIGSNCSTSTNSSGRGSGSGTDDDDRVVLNANSHNSSTLGLGTKVAAWLFGVSVDITEDVKRDPNAAQLHINCSTSKANSLGSDAHNNHHPKESADDTNTGALPPDWTLQFDGASNHSYYFNTKTGAQAWDNQKPEEISEWQREQITGVGVKAAGDSQP